MEKHHVYSGKSTISMAIFSSKLLFYWRVVAKQKFPEEIDIGITIPSAPVIPSKKVYKETPS